MKRATKRFGCWPSWPKRPVQTALALACVAVLGVAACGGGETVYPDDRYRKQAGGRSQYDPTGAGGLFGDDGLNFFGGGETPEPAPSGVAVNSFLWRASLDTLAFMPLASADPFGGVIITDWYSPPQSPDERFKVNVFILARDLRADGVRAAVFRQQLNGEAWVDAEVEPATKTDLENAILTRARQLRIASLQ